MDHEYHVSKKDQILALYHSGLTGVRELASNVDCQPSYVAQVLQGEGLITGYYDLYTTTSLPHNVYSRLFRNVLAFRSIEAAAESVKKSIDFIIISTGSVIARVSIKPWSWHSSEKIERAGAVKSKRPKFFTNGFVNTN